MRPRMIPMAQKRRTPWSSLVMQPVPIAKRLYPRAYRPEKRAAHSVLNPAPKLSPQKTAMLGHGPT